MKLSINKSLMICMACLMVIGLFSSCKESGPTLDCSNAESYNTSIETMKETLSDEDKATFDAAIMIITMSKIAELSNDGNPPEGDPEDLAMEMLEDYCGKSAKSIISKANNISF